MQKKENLLKSKDVMLKKKDEKINNYEKSLNSVIEKDNQLKTKNDEINTLKTQFSQYQSQYGGAINAFEDIRKENIKLKEELEKYKDIETSYNELVKSKEQLEKLLNENEIKDDFLIKKVEDYYDVVIDIDSINSLKKNGWEIIYNKERKSEYENII